MVMKKENVTKFMQSTIHLLYNSWVTTIVLGCFICILDIGLAIFGFLIFKDSDLTNKISPGVACYSMRSGEVH